MTLLEKLKARAAAIAKELRALLDVAAADGDRDLSDEENKSWKELDAETRTLEVSITRHTRLAELEKHAAAPATPALPLDPPDPPGRRHAPAAHVKETRPYSLLALFRGIKSQDLRACGVETRASDEIAERVGRPPEGFFVPYRALLPADKQVAALKREQEERDVQKGDTGAALVGTDLIPQEFIELLRAESAVVALGARLIPNLIGDVDIPRQIAAAAAVWMATETTDAGIDTTFDTDTVPLSPKTVAIRADMTRRMLKQSTPGIEEIVRDDIRQSIGLAVDIGAINGSGASGQPEGILNVTGIGDIDCTTGGLTWARIVEAETDLGDANALRGRLAYCTGQRILALMKTTLKESSIAGYQAENGETNGYPIRVSGNIPANTMIFGNWSEVLIGMWGVLDLFGDPYTLGDRGGLVIRGFQDIDVALRHPASFTAHTLIP